MSELWPGGPVVLPHEFWIDEHRLVLPEIPVTDLLGWLAGRMWWELIPGRLDPAQAMPIVLRHLDEDDDFDLEALHDPATVILGRMSGLATIDGTQDGWWPAHRLAVTALTDWPMYSGWCAAHGTNPLGGPLHQVMGAIYGWLGDRAGPDGADKLAQQIFGPPPHQAVAEAALPRAIRDQEAALAMAALREQLPGEVIEGEWTPKSAD